MSKGLAATLGAEVGPFREAFYCSDPTTDEAADCHFREKNIESIVATSIPEIQGSEAYIRVRRWIPGRENLFSEQTFELKTGRGAGGQWQGTKQLSWEHGSYFFKGGGSD